MDLDIFYNGKSIDEINALLAIDKLTDEQMNDILSLMDNEDLDD